MKQKLLKTMLLLCTLIVGTTVWADEVTFTFSSIASVTQATLTVDNIDLTFDKAEGANPPAFYTSGGGSWRMYSGGTVRITAESGYTITGVTSSPSAEFTITDGVATFSPSARTDFTVITVTYISDGGGELDDNDLALTGAPVALNFDLYNNSDAQVINYTTSSTGAVTVTSSEYINAEVNGSDKTITVTPLKKTASPQTITVNQAADENYAAGSVTFTVTIADSTPKTDSWELIDLADLEESDVFVIVGNNGSTYAMSNNNGTTNPPSAVAVTIENDEITSDVDDNIKWNISGNSTDGYTFYPNGTTATWLYCTNSNNGVRVGTNDNKTFKIDSEYLKHDATSRYMGVYNSTDWRCYTSNGGNIAGQTFTFYKYVNEVGVKKPVITVPETFIGSTTATITCATDGATIKYSYDGENWSNYSTALTITETKTIYAKAVKDANESDVVSKITTKTLPTPTIAIDATGITNTDVYVGTDAGSLSASVTYEDSPVEGAAVTWSGNNDEVATINATTGAVTLVAAGSVTFTATYAGNGDYAGNTATYNMTVTNSDPDAPGTENNPYTVAQARAAIDAGTGVTGVYVTGIVCEGGSSLSSGAMNYWISDDGTETNKFEIYKGKGVGGASFSATTDVQVGDVVVVTGNLTKYNTTYEFASGNQLVSLTRKPATPTFSPAAGAVISGTTVTISCATEGAVIYYTMGETPDDPTTSSTAYSAPIEITEATTIKAIAVKDEMTSDVATASYTINVTPIIDVTETTIDAPYAGLDGVITVTYNNMTDVLAEVHFFEADGTTPATYDWIVADINGDDNVEYVIEENTSTVRTAYMKVYAVGNEGDAYSELITITQAGVDYATLPFSFDGGKADITNTAGLTQTGLGSDYGSSPKLKFDGTGDVLILKLNEVPGTLSFDVKGNSYSGGTFTVQTSADGVDYSNLETYTELGATQTEEFELASTVRYIKWIYTNKVNGNVALGNIKVYSPVSVTISKAKYATYGTTKKLNFSKTGATVYTAKLSGGGVALTEVVDGIVPENQAVVIYKDVDAETVIQPSVTAVKPTADFTENALLISDGTVKGGDGIYVLSNLGSGIGFYKVKSTVTIPAGKAYLNAAGGVKEFYPFSFEEEETGLKDLKDLKDLNDVIYNLAGQRISKLQKGINIVNGKKVLF